MPTVYHNAIDRCGELLGGCTANSLPQWQRVAIALNLWLRPIVGLQRVNSRNRVGTGARESSKSIAEVVKWHMLSHEARTSALLHIGEGSCRTGSRSDSPFSPPSVSWVRL